MHWRRKWQPTPVFLPGESQGGGAWWATVCGVAQSRTRLKRLSSSSSRNLDSMFVFFLLHTELYFIFTALFLRSENSENSLQDGLWEEVNIYSHGEIFPEQPRGSSVMANPCLLPALRPASNRVVCRLCHFPTKYDDPSALHLSRAFQELRVWKSGEKATLGKGPDARPFWGLLMPGQVGVTELFRALSFAP